uniref:Uncharacterized protein n=1 Tax=Magallana gigas TaxID=29159 RepID=A0A8W8K074_MAGGI
MDQWNLPFFRQLLNDRHSTPSHGCRMYLPLGESLLQSMSYVIDEMLVDSYYHYHNSAKRKEQYSKFLEFVDVEPLKILKHSTTRTPLPITGMP